MFKDDDSRSIPATDAKDLTFENFKDQIDHGSRADAYTDTEVLENSKDRKENFRFIGSKNDFLPRQERTTPARRADKISIAQKLADVKSCRILALRTRSSELENEAEKENRNPLGKLQQGGQIGSSTIRANYTYPKFNQTPPEEKETPTLLPITEWLEGGMSGDFAARQVLDHLFLDCESHATTDSRNLAEAAQMYTDKSDAVGGVLGILSGGLPLDTCRSAKWLNDFIFSRDPKEVTREAVQWLCGVLGVFQDNEKIDEYPMSRLLGRLMEIPSSMVSLAFSRSCLQAHPHRQKGSLEDYLQKHIYLDLVQRCWKKLPRTADEQDPDSSFISAAEPDDDDE